ncbi:hypothetical protein AVEN_201578-1 [Araneus ventricosus]|uniref:Uncharacterized protein n=1 Tax=Araneus ventricosus TaxID=182803 RepID=A0A4Y2FJ34_ARAVE|nr:hypothetical protein AVEN_201578-1 [Araneus ventricosus]
MIDWVSIVRTSRRRFSSYKYIPGRIRKRKKKQAAAAEAAKVEPPPKPPTQGCACCALTRDRSLLLRQIKKKRLCRRASEGLPYPITKESVNFNLIWTLVKNSFAEHEDEWFSFRFAFFMLLMDSHQDF